jgi:uncharacterized membrane protein YhiD involved in acid resistance
VNEKMNFTEALKKIMVEGFNGTDISTTKIVLTLLVTSVLAGYIFFVYRTVTRKTFYSKTFNIAIAVISVITAGIILAMQSSLVISLGMVGALSIIRFRTAVKDPLDLIFLFWSISIGIECGAGMYEISVITSIIVTIGLLALELTPMAKASMILVTNSSDIGSEKELITVLKEFCSMHKIKSRNISNDKIELVIEVKTKNEGGLIQAVSNIDNIDYISLLTHEGEVTF